MADFGIAIGKTLSYEGALVDDKNDPGGLTNFGIALNSHPELTADQIRSMTREQAIAIYQKSYWNPLYDQLNDQRLANSLFDFGVNAGQHAAVQALQGVVFLTGGSAIDGEFGPSTLAATNSKVIVAEYTVERLRYYAGLNKPNYLHSWFARTIDALL